MNWRDQALCAQADPDAWFPEKGGSVRDAKRICRCCPVQEECLSYALTTQQQWGIWGGFTLRERLILSRIAAGPVAA